MEEILASIRRIIADDSNAQPPPAPKPDSHSDQPEVSVVLASGHAPSTEADVLELTQPVPTTPAFKTVRGQDVTFREDERRAPEPASIASPAPGAVVAPNQEPTMRDQDLLSPSSTATVSAAFNSLAATVLTEHARSLEDIVREMLRPMLKEWLDENLPSLVERLVRAEIDRVSRGGR
jgi:cell pole-organizing protein PopZ